MFKHSISVCLFRFSFDLSLSLPIYLVHVLNYRMNTHYLVSYNIEYLRNFILNLVDERNTLLDF